MSVGPSSASLVGAVVVAAGEGSRLGGGLPKAMREVAGEPLVVHAVRRLRAVAEVGPLVVAAPPEQIAAVAEMLSSYAVVVVPGGADRQGSVARGLAALPAAVDLVLVHDAARCLTPPSVARGVIDALRDGADAVVPVLPVADTVKRVAGSGPEIVVETVDRASLRLAQTPQGFRRAVLDAAHSAGRAGSTDDAALVEAAGGTVVTVPGSELALKVTRPLDLVVASALAGDRG